MRVPLVDLAAQEAAVADEALEAVRRLAIGGKFVLGPIVEAFERWLSNACGAAYAVGVGSGTDALELALRALGIGPGDAVITPAVSFVASAEAIAVAGARPVFCDVDDATGNLTAATVEEALDRARAGAGRVRAILPVHLFGRCAPLGELAPLARRHELAMIEDVAQALGACDVDGAPAGGVGEAGCFSFFPTKALGAWGDGGAVVTSHADVAERVRRLRAHGAVRPYVHAELGRNSRLDALQAAILLAKTARLPALHAARRVAAARYRERLRALPILLPDEPAPPGAHAWHAFVIRTEPRDALARWLADCGIESRVYYPLPLHRQPCFALLGAPPHLPVADETCRTALGLPFSAALTDEQQAYVVEQVTRFFVRGRPSV